MNSCLSLSMVSTKKKEAFFVFYFLQEKEELNKSFCSLNSKSKDFICNELPSKFIMDPKKGIDKRNSKTWKKS